jgi:hypothetical protein
LRDSPLSADHSAGIARCLAGAWRAAPPTVPVAAGDLATALHGLLRSGAGALAWRRVKVQFAGDETPAAARLHDAARALALADAAREAAITHLADLVAEAGVRAVVFKGYAVARVYAESWLRPAGDIDLIVQRADAAAINAALLRRADPRVTDPAAGKFVIVTETGHYEIDLHTALDPIYALTAEAVVAGAAPLAGALLAPSPEHHLRLVAAHLLKHGGWRPLWLVDIAALVEAAGPDFDWPLALGNDGRAGGWIRGVVAAARDLLGCHTDHTPIAEPAPAWLVRSLLAAWRSPDPARHRAPRLALLRDPAAWLATRWPGPIRSGFVAGGRAARRAGVLRQLACFGGDLVEGVRLRRANAAQAPHSPAKRAAALPFPLRKRSKRAILGAPVN